MDIVTETAPKPNTPEPVEPTSSYHRSPATIAAALRALASDLDRLGDTPIALTWLYVNMQITEHGGATPDQRLAAAEVLAGGFGLGEKLGYYGNSGLCSTNQSLVHGADVDVYGKMAPPARILAAAWDGAYAERDERDAALAARHQAHVAESVECVLCGHTQAAAAVLADPETVFDAVSPETAAALPVVVGTVDEIAAQLPDDGENTAAIQALIRDAVFHGGDWIVAHRGASVPGRTAQYMRTYDLAHWISGRFILTETGVALRNRLLGGAR